MGGKTGLTLGWGCLPANLGEKTGFSHNAPGQNKSLEWGNKPVLNPPEITSESPPKPVLKENTQNAFGYNKNTGKNRKSALAIPWGKFEGPKTGIEGKYP